MQNPLKQTQKNIPLAVRFSRADNQEPRPEATGRTGVAQRGTTTGGAAGFTGANPAAPSSARRRQRPACTPTAATPAVSGLQTPLALGKPKPGPLGPPGPPGRSRAPGDAHATSVQGAGGPHPLSHGARAGACPSHSPTRCHGASAARKSSWRGSNPTGFLESWGGRGRGVPVGCGGGGGPRPWPIWERFRHRRRSLPSRPSGPAGGTGLFLQGVISGAGGGAPRR